MATLGKTSDGASTSLSSADKTVTSAVTATSSGVVTAGHFRAWLSATGSTTTKVVIYADSAGNPGALLASSDAATLTITAEAQTNVVFSGANRITVVNGTTYHVGLAWLDPGTPSVTFSRDNTASQRNEASSYLPDPFGAPTALTGPVDVYVDVEPASGAFFALFGQ